MDDSGVRDPKSRAGVGDGDLDGDLDASMVLNKHRLARLCLLDVLVPESTLVSMMSRISNYLRVSTCLREATFQYDMS